MPFICHDIGTMVGTYSLINTSSTQAQIVFYEIEGNNMRPGQQINPALGTTWGPVWNPNGTSFVVGTASSPYWAVYNRIGNSFVKLANPPALQGQGYRPEWNPDGSSIAIGSNIGSRPYLYVFNRVGDTFQRVPNTGFDTPSYGQTWGPNGCAWSPDGKSLAVCGDSTPFLTVFNRVGTSTFVTISTSSFSALPTGTTYECAWSPDGTTLAVAGSVSPFIYFYNRSGNTFTKVANPASLPTNLVLSVDFTTDGQTVAFGLFTSPWLAIYNRNNTTSTYERIALPANPPTNQIFGLRYSANDLLAMNIVSNPTKVFRKSGTSTYTLLPTPTANWPSGLQSKPSFWPKRNGT